MGKPFLLIIILLIVYSCKTDNKDITGNYEADIPNMAVRYMTNTTYSQGLQLSLNKDSTYIMKGCQISKGRWKYKNDSIYLYCNHIRFAIHSFNYLPDYKKGTICDTLPTVYSMDNNILLNCFKIRNSTTMLCERLKKTN